MVLPLLRKNEALFQRYTEKSGAFKFLLWIIIIKPIFNTLVGLDFLGISVSILQLFGLVIVLTLIWGLTTSHSSPIKDNSAITYTLFFIIYAFNLIMVVVFNPDLNTFRDFVKILTIPLIFYFYYRTINNELDIELIFYAFLLSIIPLALVFIYDSVVVSSYQETRGINRIDTSFGDITTFGLHINSVFVIALYRMFNRKTNKKVLIQVILISFFGLFVLINIAHGSSFGVFMATTVIFIFFFFRKNFFLLVLISTVLIVPSYLIFSEWFNTFFTNFYGNEIEALNAGQSLNEGRFFHGRMSRWQRHFELFEDQNFFDQLFGGISLTHPYMIGNGPHNDFLRIVLTCGYAGLGLYLLFILQLFFKSISINSVSIRFLGLATLANLIIYSITTTPSVYVDYNLFVMASFAILAKKPFMPATYA